MLQPNAMTSTAPELQIVPPRLLTMGTVLIISAYGLLLVIPVLLAIVFVSLRHLGVLTFLLPLLAAGLTTYFLPLGFGNPYVVRLARSLRPPEAGSSNGFVAQITFVPRIRSGVRALLEDADDIGWLSLSEAELTFLGDSVRLRVPFNCVHGLRAENIGWRGVFLYGRQSVVDISGLSNVTGLKLAERSSWFLPASRTKARELQSCLAAKAKLAG